MIRFWWALGAVLLALATFVCLAPTEDVPGAFEINDKLSHVFGHAALVSYFCGLVPRQRWYKVAAFQVSFGLLIELLQHLLPTGREADLYDVLANVSGLVLGLLLSHLGLCRWPNWFARILGQRSVP